MKRSISKHDYVVLFAVVASVAAIVVMIMNPDTRGWAVIDLLYSVVATIGAVLLSRYWIKRASVPSFGTLMVVPLTCALLPFFLGVCLFGEWDLLTPSYWQQAKGGWSSLYFPLAITGCICFFPTAAVVAFYQGRQMSDARRAS